MQASRQSSPAQGDCRDAFLLFWGSSFPLQRIKSSMERGQGCERKAPLVASADAKSSAIKKTSTGIVSRCWSVAPIWRDNVELVKRAAWGRSCGSAKLLPAPFVERVGHTGRPWNSWGVAPNPTRELRPLTPQGTSSLDPFSASRLECASFTRL